MVEERNPSAAALEQVAAKDSMIASLREELIAADAETKRLQDDLAALRQDLSVRQLRTDDLSWEVTSLRRDMAKLRHLLAFRLGNAIVKNLSVKSFWKIPFSMLQAHRHYQRDKPIYLKREFEYSRLHDLREKRASEKLLLEEKGWPEPIAGAILWQAQRLEESNGVEDACDFISTFGGTSTQFTRHLMECNRAGHDDQRWAEHLNAYLNQFELAAVTLKPGSESKLNRLHAAVDRKVTEGPMVSVIMPAFNAARTIRTAVSSILEQTWQPLELIIVDDHSTDTTLQLAHQMAANDGRIKVLSNAVNVGPYVSKNRALNVAAGRWITGHDADDWAHPERIEKQLGVMLERPSLKACIANMIRIDEKGRFSHFSKIGKTSPDGAQRLASISCFFEADFLREKLGYWDSVRFGGDSEMIERARTLLGARFEVTDILSMICLDAHDSLTNDPLHGVSKTNGISSTRQYYRDQWTEWHSLISEQDAYIELIQNHRRFDAPEAALVPIEDVRKVMSA